MKNPIVTINMENGGVIKAELYPEVAPNTVKNFISLVNKGFYDGVIFHRVIPNGFKNDLKHSRGVLSMARTMVHDSAGSQFFIMVADAPHLDNQYAAFGKVIEGMEVADDIVKAKRDYNDKPLEDQKMVKVTVDTFGETYDEPEKVGK